MPLPFTVLGLVVCATTSAEASDTYFCETEVAVGVENGESVEYGNFNFNIKVDRKTLKFGPDNYYKSYEMPIDVYANKNFWSAETGAMRVKWADGKLLTSETLKTGKMKGVLVLANCKPF